MRVAEAEAREVERVDAAVLEVRQQRGPGRRGHAAAVQEQDRLAGAGLEHAGASSAGSASRSRRLRRAIPNSLSSVRSAALVGAGGLEVGRGRRGVGEGGGGHGPTLPVPGSSYIGRAP